MLMHLGWALSHKLKLDHYDLDFDLYNIKAFPGYISLTIFPRGMKLGMLVHLIKGMCHEPHLDHSDLDLYCRKAFTGHIFFTLDVNLTKT